MGCILLCLYIISLAMSKTRYIISLIVPKIRYIISLVVSKTRSIISLVVSKNTRCGIVLYCRHYAAFALIQETIM